MWKTLAALCEKQNFGSKTFFDEANPRVISYLIFAYENKQTQVD